MRPEAPPLMLPPEDPEQTPAETPLAREVQAALRGPLRALRMDLAKMQADAMREFEGRVCEGLVDAVNRSAAQRSNERRLDALEEHCFKTEPAPPLEGAE
jgi:hypothetical protein